MNTTTMKWLLQREFWENKGSMLWAPAIIGALLVVLVGGTIGYGIVNYGMPGHVTINGRTFGGDSMNVLVSADMKMMIARIASSSYLATATPLLLVLSAVVFFYCLGALYDERRDRSILFWKSLPVSDQMTVASKAATAMLVAPLIVIAIATVVSLALLLIVCAAVGLQGMNMFGPVFLSPDLYLGPLRLLALLPVYVVWALPTVGWLLLVSSWARTKPFLWAVGIPVVGLILVKWISTALLNFSGQELSIMPVAQDVVARLLSGVVPGIWYTYPGMPQPLQPTQFGVDGNSIVTSAYASLAGIDAWIGAAAGALMLFGATRLRRWRDEG